MASYKEEFLAAVRRGMRRVGPLTRRMDAVTCRLREDRAAARQWYVLAAVYQGLVAQRRAR